MDTLDAGIADLGPPIEERLAELLGADATPLGRAMADAVLSRGRRVRARLVLLACIAAGGRAERALAFAAAIEMVHAASLALDDLPAMDDDRERRGAPALHRRHGEAAAILAAVALLARAIEVAADHDRRHGTDAAACIARAVGAAGMCGGQAADLAACGGALAPDALEALYRAKTGRLMATACEIGAMAAGATAPARAALAGYGMALGVAYQIADDVADRARDAAAGRPNHAMLSGIGAARDRVAGLREEAVRTARDAGLHAAALDVFAADLLRDRLDAAS